MNDNNAKIERPNRPVTCSGDVVELLKYTAGKGHRSFTLCKVSMCYSAKNTMWVYMLFVEGDEYPVVISKEYAKRILENPHDGSELVYSCWMQRYR